MPQTSLTQVENDISYIVNLRFGRVTHGSQQGAATAPRTSLGEARFSRRIQGTTFSKTQPRKRHA